MRDNTYMRANVLLRCRTDYSLSAGLMRPNDLAKRVADAGYVACGLADTGTLMGSVRFQTACQDNGLKSIIGADFMVAHGESVGRMTAYAKNQDGYKDLCKLVSMGEQVPLEKLAPLSPNLVLLSGFDDGLARHADGDMLRRMAGEVDTLCVDIDRSRDNHALEAFYLSQAESLGLCPVAVEPVYYRVSANTQVVQARWAVKHSCTLDAIPQSVKRDIERRGLPDSEAFAQRYADLPELVENANAIAIQCTAVLPDSAPKMPALGPVEGSAARLRQAVESKASGRIPDTPTYSQRIEAELDTIAATGFSDYFLIVADYMQHARDQGIPVGPGRGSAAGSLVAYTLGITDVDPIEHGLIFERFLTAERVAPPDIDSDFGIVDRQKIFEYIADKYPPNQTAYIGTVGTFAAKAAILDAARVLGHPPSDGARLSAMIPNEPGVTLTQALASNEPLKRAFSQDGDIQSLFALASALEGTARQVGTHPAGIIVSPVPITDLCAVTHIDGQLLPTVQLDMADVENVGLIKFDLLGLKTLSIIDRALEIIGQDANKVAHDFGALEDSETYAMIAQGDTDFVFQLESSGMRSLLRSMKTRAFEDIVVAAALYRPGPINSGMLESFVARRSGNESVQVPHDCIASILEPTYGVIVYQEQVMQIAQVMAGYTLAQADELRRAMGKKKQAAMDRHKVLFCDGAVANGIDKDVALDVFETCAGFAKYGFNKSHAAAYAMLAFQTAYLKRHHPSAFFQAVIEFEEDRKKIPVIVSAAKRSGITVLPPSVRDHDGNERQMRLPIASINGIGKQLAQEITQSGRTSKTLSEFLVSGPRQMLTKHALSALARSGALDCFEPNRAAVAAYAEQNAARLVSALDTEETGQSGLFGSVQELDIELPQCSLYTHAELCRAERETLNCYLTSHPAEYAPSPTNNQKGIRLSNLEQDVIRNGSVDGLVVALVTSIRKTRTASGFMQFITIEQEDAAVEAVSFDDLAPDAPKVGRLYEFSMTASPSPRDDLRISLRSCTRVESPREAFVLFLPEECQSNEQAKRQVVGSLTKHKGQCPVYIAYPGQPKIPLPTRFRFDPAAAASAFSEIETPLEYQHLELN